MGCGCRTTESIPTCSFIAAITGVFTTQHDPNTDQCNLMLPRHLWQDENIPVFFNMDRSSCNPERTSVAGLANHQCGRVKAQYRFVVFDKHVFVLLYAIGAFAPHEPIMVNYCGDSAKWHGIFPRDACKCCVCTELVHQLAATGAPK